MIPRQITSILKNRLKKFPILSLTGPRQSGKTTLLKNEFPDFNYFNLERPDLRELIISDPMGFLKSQGPKVIFDEAQRLPELFSYIQVLSDERGIPGQYILSGSQSFLINNHISQSLAGRTHISHLLPFGLNELSLKPEEIQETIFNGFYPRLHDVNIEPTEFYPSYIQTYIERDVRSLKAIENLNTFSRFMGLCAGRIGQVLNLSSLANDAGISVNTVKSWLSLLESSFILFQLQPFYKNYNKRLIKSPKIYFYDTGLACSLLKIQNSEMIRTHYLYGALYENLIISEIVKQHHHAGKMPSVYYWRESNGTEIDCIIELSSQKIIALEIKAGETFNKDYLKNFKNLPSINDNIEKTLIYTGNNSTSTLDVKLIGHGNFKQFLTQITN
ncbi:MAG TPA: AAA family ATPase [Bacteroidales bacterium]|nr:AAA family ATPase [Bacteroidales bacterium]